MVVWHGTSSDEGLVQAETCGSILTVAADGHNENDVAEDAGMPEGPYS